MMNSGGFVPGHAYHHQQQQQQQQYPPATAPGLSDYAHPLPLAGCALHQSHQGQDPPHHAVPAATVAAYARMGKRKRADADHFPAAHADGAVWDPDAPVRQPQPYPHLMPPPRQSHPIGAAPQMSPEHFVADASGRSHHVDPSWQPHNSAAVSSPYPELPSYSNQPYLYQPSDPNAYNSSWAPPSGDFISAAQHQPQPAHNYPLPQQSSVTMPYFPPVKVEAPLGAGEGIDEKGLQAYHPQASSAVHPPRFAYFSPSDGTPHEQAAGRESGFSYDDANMHLKVQSLPILDNLAIQLIHTISKSSFPHIQEIVRGNETEDSQAYATVKNLFNQTRKVYSRETQFIDAIAIQMFQPTQQEIIRKANIATFISSVLGAHDVGFFHLNEFFMETFVPLGQRLLKWQGAILLELKTQTYISAIINSEGSPEAMLDELFPPDLDAQILTRHPDAPSLSPSEQDFIDRSRARKSYLLAEDCSDEAVRELSRKYQWPDFVREFASCISKNIDSIMNVHPRLQPAFNVPATSATADRRIATAINDSYARNTTQPPPATTDTHPTTAPSPSGQHPPQPAPSTSHPPPILRQPWTKPEEDALIAGLDRVSGPHWSQILALYGRGGSVSEVLKDRNQVQLKDKARNLKLWYLKTGREVPRALQGVTGELRKRGGARVRAALGEGGAGKGD